MFSYNIFPGISENIEYFIINVRNYSILIYKYNNIIDIIKDCSEFFFIFFYDSIRWSSEFVSFFLKLY